MQRQISTFSGNFSNNTMYRFLNSVKTNWQRFVVHLASGIIRNFLKSLTHESRQEAFIVDMTMTGVLWPEVDTGNPTVRPNIMLELLYTGVKKQGQAL